MSETGLVKSANLCASPDRRQPQAGLGGEVGVTCLGNVEGFVEVFMYKFAVSSSHIPQSRQASYCSARLRRSWSSVVTKPCPGSPERRPVRGARCAVPGARCPVPFRSASRKMRPVPRCDPRWLCLLLPLLLLLLTVCGNGIGHGGVQGDTGEGVPGSPSGLPGEHAEQHCEGQNCSTKCLPCNDHEFTEYPNDFLKCLRCRVCREDQVEISPCQATRDTQCACRSGTFCSPDHPCEMCQKCRPRCPKGEVELAPCMPHSDRRCGPPTDNVLLAVGLVVLVLLLLLGLFVLWRCCCRRSSGDGRDLSSKSCSTLDYLVQQLRRVRGGDLGTRDNDQNERRDKLLPGAPGPGTASLPGPQVHQWYPLAKLCCFSLCLHQAQGLGALFVLGLPGCFRLLSFQVMVPRTSAIHRRNLVPVPGSDPVKVLRRSFDLFAEVVPLKDWRRYGRALDLLDNDIDLAEQNNKYSRECFVQILTTWHNKQGLNASVNTLLDTLHQISLGGIADSISTSLVQQGLFQHEGS
ncbi:tumor necrosis factor receptor superfamily member 10B [Dryobates pubescens]|uniref:tumor necrosis factor receptor superfamily member 10B n=1 Tax=Dryobates pubescens TaxID=118200 RepID=UPI0023B9995B|nr:tumor necrosis factor receptor superfamily member 10B [Dryobates pubescens]